MSHIEQLEARLCRLETRHRRVQLLCVASCTLLVGACLTAAFGPVSPELRARRFVLVDEAGAERGALETKEGASLFTLSGTDASLILGAGEAEFEGTIFKGFRTSYPDGETEDLYETRVTKGPWAGVIAHATTDGHPSLAMLQAAGANTSLDAAHGSCSGGVGFASDTVVLSMKGGSDSSSHLRVGSGASLLTMEGGQETFGVVNIVAGEDGVWLGGDWNDEHDFDLMATKEEARLELSTRTGPSAWTTGEERPPQPPPEIELSSTGGVGAVLVRSGDEVVFKAP